MTEGERKQGQKKKKRKIGREEERAREKAEKART